MVLRSDEAANQAQIERDKKYRGNIKKAAATVATTAGTAAAVGSGLASKVMPFFNQYIPTALAIKGINKVSPQLGSFLKKGQDMGLNVEEGMNFIKDKLSKGEKQRPANQERNIIEQYSPELHQFIKERVGKGDTPIAAGLAARTSKKFDDAITKLTKDHKSPWSSIVESVFGNGQTAQPTQQQNPQQSQNQPSGNWDQIEQTLQSVLNS